MRRGLLSPSAVMHVIVDPKYQLRGNLSLEYLHSNEWVWKLIEISTDRCLDIMKAAVSIQNNEGYKQFHQQDTEMDQGEGQRHADIIIQIPEAIVEAVEAAAETCCELYVLLVPQLLYDIHVRHQFLVSSGQESSQSVESGKLSSLDPRLVSDVSVVTRVMRNFSMVNIGLRESRVHGTSIPTIVTSNAASKRLLELLGVQDYTEENLMSRVTESLAGPARRIWQNNQNNS